MTDLTTHLLANPRGREYSYAVRIRGLPYLWTDGRATWTYNDARAVIHGGLAKTDFNFDFKSDPQNPLDVGGGVTIHLLDDPSRRTRYLFSPERTNAVSYLAVAADPGTSPSSTSFTVADGSVFSEGQDIYYGLETGTISTIAGNVLTVARGAYGSPKLRLKTYFDGAQAATRGTEIRSLPDVWRGRYVDVYMAPIDADGTAGQHWTLWAGRVASFTSTGRTIRVSCDSLTAAMDKDSWPDPLPAGTTGTDTTNYYLKGNDFRLFFAATAGGVTPNASSEGLSYEMGYYNSGGVFTKVNTEGWYTLQQLAQYITDTLIAGAVAILGGAGTYADLKNNFAIAVQNSEGWLVLHYRNETDVKFTIYAQGLIAQLLGVAQNLPILGPDRFTVQARNEGDLFGQMPRGFSISRQQSASIALFPNNKRDIPTENGCYNAVDAEMQGYVKVSDGEKTELMSFNAVTDGGDGTVRLSLVDRGLGGTKVSAFGMPWGGGGEAKNVTIEQVAVVRTGTDMDAADVLLFLLLSIDGMTSLNDSTYDKLGPRMGLGLPADLVDIDGIRSRMRMGDMPKPGLFWIEGSGKGKEALTEFMKAFGVYFVTRRFERNGEYLFGLSVDLVDVPVGTRYNVSLTDSHLSADSVPETDVNERLLINTIAISPYYEFGKDVGDTGGKRFVYAEESIGKYGLSKALEIKATALFNIYSSLYGGEYNGNEQIATAIATHVGLRWFGAFASGNFTIELKTPHVGWAIQPGDRVLLNLSNGVNPNGDDGFSEVTAKVVDQKCSHGPRAGSQITLRINTTRAAELAPVVEITDTQAGGTILVCADNAFSDSFAGVPFDGDTSPVKDIQWFNALRHTDQPFKIVVWEEGNYTNRATVTVTASTYGTGRLVVTPGIGAGLTAIIGSGRKLYATLNDYVVPTYLQAQYAYIGTNASFSQLGTLDGSTTDVETQEWL